MMKTCVRVTSNIQVLMEVNHRGTLLTLYNRREP